MPFVLETASYTVCMQGQIKPLWERKSFDPGETLKDTLIWAKPLQQLCGLGSLEKRSLLTYANQLDVLNIMTYTLEKCKHTEKINN